MSERPTNEEIRLQMTMEGTVPKDVIDKWNEHPVDDPVNHPAHYCQNGIQTIDVIEAWGLDFCLGNTVKYISRAGKKDPTKTIQDLEKARWYLDREIANLRSQMTVSVQEARE